MNSIQSINSPFFSGDNVTVMIVFTIAAFVVILLTVIVHLFNRSHVGSDITVAQIRADAEVKVAQLRGEADIKVAEFEAMAETRCAELESGSPSEPASAGGQ